MKDFDQIEKMCLNCHKLMSQPGGVCEYCGFDNSAPKSPHHLPPRTILAGKYMTGRVLGEGGFGITYMGYDLNLDCTVAIKEYYPAGFVSRETTIRNTVSFLTGMDQDYYNTGMEKFLNEAKALAKFSELPGIVRVRDFFRENGTAYIVMDYIEGTTLAQELEALGGRMPAAEVLNRMEPLIRSLSVVHKNGVIHRDISPDNIMQNTRGELKLLDFGAARELASDSKSISVMLKPGYAPEEQYRTHGEQGPWTDCYAVCATMYKLMTGVTPPESLERMADDKLVPPTRLGASLTMSQEQALLMGMAVKVENRFKSMEALYNALYAEGVPAWNAPAESESKGFPLTGPETTHQKTVPIQPINSAQPARPVFQPDAYRPDQAGPQKKKAPVGLLVGIGLAAVAAVVALIFLLKPGGSAQVAATTPGVTTEAAQSPTPVPTSYAGAFGTPVPTESSTVSGTLSLGNGYISVPDFQTFTGLDIQDQYTNADGSTVQVYYFDQSSLVEYVSMVYDSSDYVVNATGSDTNLFYVQQNGGAYIAFEYVDGMLELVTPAGATMNTFEPGVTYYYLQNNGLTYDQWLALGNSYYNSNGVNYRGNTAANIINGSCVAIQGRYVYYSEYTDTGYIYRMNIDTGESELILEQTTFARHLNVQGDFLYFTTYNSSDDYRTIYRCSAEPGSDDVVALRANASLPYVVGDYIYFRDTSDNSLRRMDLNGGSEEIVVATNCFFINPLAGSVYATDIDGTGIFYIDSYTLTPTKIADNDVYQMIVCGQYIYYTSNSDDGYRIYRMNSDGSNQEMICDMAATSLNWDGEDIYFIGKDDSCLYRVSMEGGDAVKMADSASDPAILAENDYVMVFYITSDGMTLKAYSWSTNTSADFPF